MRSTLQRPLSRCSTRWVAAIKFRVRYDNVSWGIYLCVNNLTLLLINDFIFLSDLPFNITGNLKLPQPKEVHQSNRFFVAQWFTLDARRKTSSLGLSQAIHYPLSIQNCRPNCRPNNKSRYHVRAPCTSIHTCWSLGFS